MDSSLPVLVSRLPDRRALTHLVRAALRHEVAQVELTRGPDRADPHTLDLHVAGQPPLALLAEPAGPPQNGRFPLRLRPLYRAQAAQLYALLEAENVSVDGPSSPPPDTSPVHTQKPETPAPDTIGFNKTLALDPEAAQKAAADHQQQQQHQQTQRNISPRAGVAGDAGPIARAMSGAAPPPVIVSTTAAQSPVAPQQVIQIAAPRPSTARTVAKSSAALAADDPRRTVPSATWGSLTDDPRRTVPSANWGGAAARSKPLPAAGSPPPPQQPITEQTVPVTPPSTPPSAGHGADADDPSLSVSVVFEPDDMPAAIQAMTAQAIAAAKHQAAAAAAAAAAAPTSAAPQTPPLAASPVSSVTPPKTISDFPADLDEPSLSVSVVFEADAIPAALLRGIPSPIADTTAASPRPPMSRGDTAPPATQIDVPSSDIPATIADLGPSTTAGLGGPEPRSSSSSSVSNGDLADMGMGFFDDALANFPTEAFEEDPSIAAKGPSKSARPPPRPPPPPIDDDSPEIEASEPFDVQLDEVELLDEDMRGPPPTELDDDGLVPVPPPPSGVHDDDADTGVTAASANSAARAAAAVAAAADEDLSNLASDIDNDDTGDHDRVPVPPPPDDDDDDDDNDATLIRLPSASSMRAAVVSAPPRVVPPPPVPVPAPPPLASKPIAERPQIVRKDGGKQELTPTQQTNIGVQAPPKKKDGSPAPAPVVVAAAAAPEPVVQPKKSLPPPSVPPVQVQAQAPAPPPPPSVVVEEEPKGRKKKSTRRKANANAPGGSESMRKKETEQGSASFSAAVAGFGDTDDTAAFTKAPVKHGGQGGPASEQRPPPSLIVEVDEPPSSRSPRNASDPDPAIGRRIADGKYIIESLIGSGAAGAVYRATHRELRRTVAIKILHPHYQQDPHFMTSFRGEALAASQLDHPNVMRVLDFDQEADGLIYIVMEYLSGRTLQSLLDEERRLPTERAVEIMIQVCAALSVAHDHGIIHRDIKPDNIMLVPSRNDEGTTFELVKVCDFGIAALQNPRAEDVELAANEHVIAGTPEYMSPEQARGIEIDARSDVYACGICLYELVTGRPPFLGDNPAEILIKQLEELPKPPSQIIKGLDPIIEEVILRATQKDPSKRHQSAREMRVELKELIEPTNAADEDDEDELSIVENVPMLDDPASGFPGFFIAFSSAILRFGRFERGHTESAQAMKELQKSMKTALRGRSELTFARRDVQKQIGFCVMSGTAEIADLRRLLGSQLFGSFGEPFIEELVNKGIAALTLREGIPDVELHYLIEMLLGPFSHEDLRKELLSKPLRNLSVLFVSDVVGRDRKLSWKVGLCAARLARDLLALCNVRGISLKKMRETRDELIGGVARLLTRGDEVRQFIFNADLVDEAVQNLRGFSSFQVAPLIIERVLHESCAETATILLTDFDAGNADQEQVRSFLHLFAQRLVTERSQKSDAAVAEFYRRAIITEDEMPRDLKESIRAQTLADALVREPSQFLLTLDLINNPETYAHELSTLEAAMGTLARRSEAVALLAVMSTLARHAKGGGKPGPRENAALRTMKSMIDKNRLQPIANTLLVGPPHQREAARQLIVIAGSVGAQALYNAREATTDPAARPIFVKVFRDTGPAGWTLLSQVLPALQVRDDAELALVEDLLYTLPDRQDPVLGEAVSKFLSHPLLRASALAAIVPLWGDRARKPLVEALEYAEEPTRIVALNELRRMRSIDEYVFNVLERFLTMRGSAGEELRAAAAAALADAATPVRARAIQLLSKAVEGKRGFIATLRGDTTSDESVVVMEAMGRALLALDRNEGIRAIKGRVSRSEGAMKARLQVVLQTA